MLVAELEESRIRFRQVKLQRHQLTQETPVDDPFDAVVGALASA
jgi:hypothetical protein